MLKRCLRVPKWLADDDAFLLFALGGARRVVALLTGMLMASTRDPGAHALVDWHGRHRGQWRALIDCGHNSKSERATGLRCWS